MRTQVHSLQASNHELTYRIGLPEGYDPLRPAGYPVLYWLQGGDGGEYGWDPFLAKLDIMIAHGRIEPVIAVIPDGGNSCLADSAKYDDIEAAITRDLIDAVDTRWNSLASREGRLLAGLSMGGFGALRYALAYPHLFSGAILLSPVLQYDELPSLRSYARQPFRVPVYIVAGDGDGERLEGAIRLYTELSRRNVFDADFAKGDAVPASPAELRILNGGHRLNVWLTGFEEGLQYLQGKPESAAMAPRYAPADYDAVCKGNVSLHALPAFAYQVYLPYGYEADTIKRYPVLYLLHGSGGNANSWQPFWPILDHLVETGELEPVIAVAPITGNSYWVNSAKFGRVEAAVIEELLPLMDRQYRTRAERGSRKLAGFSMGGYGALRYSLVYPHLFGGAVLLSPAIQDEEAPVTSGAVTMGAFGEPFEPSFWESSNYPQALKAYGAQRFQVPMYIIAGDDDWNHVSEKEDLPPHSYRYNMEVQAVRLYRRLQRSGSPAALRIVNGGHDMHIWAYGFHEGLLYLFRG